MDTFTILVLVGAGLVTGFSKFSVGGMGLLILPVVMIAFPGPQALAIIVPMYIITDVIAASTYKQEIQWAVIFRILPAGMLGVILGGYTLSMIDAQDFNLILGALILFIVALGFWLDYYPAKYIQHPSAAYLTGIVVGTFSLMANAAGPLISLFLAEQKLDKTAYISTRTWLFFSINLLKLPMLYYIGLLNTEALSLSLYCIPGLLVGAWIGHWFLRRINFKQLKWVIRGLAVMAAIKLFGFS